jgi:UDP-hydrolysing UDP-N-acetyl-D-glucosamine 2-epimerase
MRQIAVVTVGRSDYGIYLPLLEAIRSDPDLELRLIVAGMHLSPEFGRTVHAIEQDRFEIADRIEMLVASDTPEAIAKSMGLGLIGYAQAYNRDRPDVLVVLGDRFEMHAATLAALPFKIPVAHIHGGEVTAGAIDDALRHSMTKLSHLHFVSTEDHGRRVLQLGEEPWRVLVCGALGLDNLGRIPFLDRSSLSERIGVKLPERFLLVTYHPVTLEYEETERQVTQLLAALDGLGLAVLFTMPNADTGGNVIRTLINSYVNKHPSAHAVENLGTEGYFSAMSLATALVGNSSSGLIEAPSFGLPAVNVGNRQQGRLQGPNVINVGYSPEEIDRGIREAIDPAFRASLAEQRNPYGDGGAADRIISMLKTTKLDQRLIVKEFHAP